MVELRERLDCTTWTRTRNCVLILTPLQIEIVHLLQEKFKMSLVSPSISRCILKVKKSGVKVNDAKVKDAKIPISFSAVSPQHTVRFTLSRDQNVCLCSSAYGALQICLWYDMIWWNSGGGYDSSTSHIFSLLSEEQQRALQRMCERTFKLSSEGGQCRRRPNTCRHINVTWMCCIMLLADKDLWAFRWETFRCLVSYRSYPH